MTDETDGQGSHDAEIVARVARLERRQGILRGGLVLVGAIAVAALAAVGWLLSQRRTGEPTDTIVARRFVVEQDGHRRAMFGMDSTGRWALLLLGPATNRDMGIAMGEMGQLHVRAGNDVKTSIIGSQVLIAGPSGGVAGFGQSDGQPWWSFSETDKRPRVLSARGRAGPAYIDSLLHASLDLGDSTQP